MNAYILINTEAGKVMDALAGIKAVSGVKSAHATIGPYDIIAFVEFSDPAELTSMIVDNIQKVAGVSKTLTCITGG